MAISKVTSGGIADGTLSVEDIKDDAVTAAKLANSINTDIATGVTGNTTANAAMPKAGGAMTGAITTNSTFDGVDIATRDGVLTSTTATAAAALPKAGGAMTGTITNLRSTGIDDNANALAMTIDSSENVMVTKTSLNDAVVGVELRANGIVVGSADGNVGAVFNRNSSDGDIIAVKKGGTTVGSIGVASNDNLTISASATNHGGVYFGTNTVIPMLSGSTSSDTVDLGNNGTLWRNLYLSGGAYIGGTGAANKLGDYETGTWTAGFTGGTISVNNSTGHYTKVGRKVFFQYYTSSMAISSAGNSARITGLPFTSSNTADTYGLFNYQHGNAVDGGCRGGFIGKNDTQLVFTDTDSTDQPIYVNGSPRYIMVAGSYFVD